MNQEMVEIVELDNGGVWVESRQHSACDSCQARSGCGQHSLSKLGHATRLWVPSTDTDLNVGDEVMVTIPDGGLAFSALTLYGLPLLVLIAGAVLGSLWAEWLSLGLATIGLVAGLWLARQVSAKYQTSWQPSIHRQCQRIDAQPVTSL